MFFCNVCGNDVDGASSFFTSKYSRINICGDCAGVLLETISQESAKLNNKILPLIETRADDLRDENGDIKESLVCRG